MTFSLVLKQMESLVENVVAESAHSLHCFERSILYLFSHVQRERENLSELFLAAAAAQNVANT